MIEQHDVFLSFAHPDYPLVRQVAVVMAQMNLPTWEPSAQLRPDSNWVEEIEAAIEAHNRFVFFVSPAYMQSQWGNYELGYAMSRQRVQGGEVVVVILGEDRLFTPSRYLERFNVIDGRDKSPRQIAVAIARAFDDASRVVTTQAV